MVIMPHGSGGMPLPAPQQGCLEKDPPQRRGGGGSRRASTPGGVYVCAATITSEEDKLW